MEVSKRSEGATLSKWHSKVWISSFGIPLVVKVERSSLPRSIAPLYSTLGLVDSKSSGTFGC